METSKKILIVDDEKNHRLMLRLHLEDNGHECFEASDGIEVEQMLENISPDLILLDITMEVMDGLTLLHRLRDKNINIPTIIITANTDVKTAVSAMKIGATDFLTKPVDVEELLDLSEKLLYSSTNNTQQSIDNIDYKFDGVYKDKNMVNVINMLSMVAPTDATVLILGESGTGKELIAKSIHDNSPRASKPFIAVNCAALNDNLIESELFGHIKGAFTGATTSRIGRFEQAHNGTIFLDELGEIPLSTQTKLLRVIQEKVFEPVGSNKSIKTDVRIVAATNKDIKSLSESGEFRQDLYFRLSVFPIVVPPLRDRNSDIEPLVNYFIKKYATGFGKNITGASKDYINQLKIYSFPGNIRELENIVERSIILSSDNKLSKDTLPSLSTKHSELNLKSNEKDTIIDALNQCNGNKSNAAKLLGISRRALYNKIEQYKLDN